MSIVNKIGGPFSLHVPCWNTCFFLISMAGFKSSLDHAYFFLRSSLVSCLVHAYLLLKSSLAMLISYIIKFRRFKEIFVVFML